MKWHLVVGKSVFLLAYGLLHDLEQFSGTEERFRRISDAYGRSEKGNGCTALHGQIRLEVGVDVLQAVDSAYASDRAIRLRRTSESHRLERLMYTKQTVYDMLQLLDQSCFIYLIAIGTRWHFLDASVISRCHCYHKATSKAAAKSLFLVVHDFINIWWTLVGLEAPVALSINTGT